MPQMKCSSGVTFWSILLLCISSFTSIAHSAPALPDQTDLALPDYNTTTEGHVLSSRDKWFNVRWPGTGGKYRVWAGKQPCPLTTNLIPLSNQLAAEAYASMVADGTKDNLVAVLCIAGVKCYAGTIPDRNAGGRAFVAEQMKTVPTWVTAFGQPGANVVYHAEDLAIALAAEDGARFPYTVPVPSKDANNNDITVNVKGRMSVYGLYSDKNNNGRDGFGSAGIRWPCTSVLVSQRPKACFTVLKTLDFTYDYKTGNGGTATTNQ